MAKRHLELVLVLTAVDQGAGSLSELCDSLECAWSDVEPLVDELVRLGKLERSYDVVRRARAKEPELAS